MNIIDNDLLSIQESRILVENAYEAHKKLATFSQEMLDKIVDAMIYEIENYIIDLAKMSNEETEYGKYEDKCIKNSFVCKFLRQRLKGMKCIGIINEDKENMTMDIGVPMGVIVAFSPSTSPISTTIYKALIAIKSGNAIIFSPHPRAKNAIFKALDILIKVAEENGLPEGALSYLHNITPNGTNELIYHRYTSLIINTGVPNLLKTIYKSGKPLIYGGTGNGPAFIERTADIRKAARDIIDSKSFDNGILSAAEQSIVVDSPIHYEVKKELENYGAYFMSEEESDKLGVLFYNSDGLSNSEIVGKTAQELAKRAGFIVDKTVKVLISQQKYVTSKNPYSKEKLCPVLAYYVEDDWMHACEKCIELLLNEKLGHTLIIHSRNEDVIRQFALKKPVGRVLVNTPGVFGSMGATTNLFPAMTLGSGSAGQGMTSDNVSPENLIYIRKVGYGVRNIEDVISLAANKNSKITSNKNYSEGINSLELMEIILKKLLDNNHK